MGKFDSYKIDLKNLAPGEHNYEFLLENKFFIDIDGTEVQKGKVKVDLSLKRTSMAFDINGVVILPCDRCLDDMEIMIETKNRLVVKFGKELAQESDEIVIIPEEEGVINLAWFLYEFVALSVPMKHVHAPGKCNKTMLSKLKKHSAKNPDDADDDSMDDDISVDDGGSTDPRWDALKGLVENDNN